MVICNPDDEKPSFNINKHLHVFDMQITKTMITVTIEVILYITLV